MSAGEAGADAIAPESSDEEGAASGDSYGRGKEETRARLCTADNLCFRGYVPFKHDQAR